MAQYSNHWTYFPSQLVLYQNHPALQIHGYGLYLVGLICLWPAVLALAQLIAPGSPRLARWGGIALILGLFARTFHVGIELLAFQMVNLLGLETAIKTIEASYVDISYGPYRFIVTLSVGYAGWMLLGIGAYRSKVTGLFGAFIIAFAGVMWGGVLKESGIVSTASLGALCFVLLPLGIRMLPKEAKGCHVQKPGQ